jgi:hypothetical protein
MEGLSKSTKTRDGPLHADIFKLGHQNMKEGMLTTQTRPSMGESEMSRVYNKLVEMKNAYNILVWKPHDKNAHVIAKCGLQIPRCGLDSTGLK